MKDNRLKFELLQDELIKLLMSDNENDRELDEAIAEILQIIEKTNEGEY